MRGNLHHLRPPEVIIFDELYKGKQFHEIFVAFLQLFLFQPFGLLPLRDAVYSLLHQTRFVAVFAPQLRLAGAQLFDARVERRGAFHPPPLLLDAHAAQRRYVAVVLQFAPEEGVLLTLQLRDPLVDLRPFEVDMPAHGADERRGKRRTVSPRHHRHVERRGARRGEDIAFGRDVRIHAVGQQPQQGPALVDVDMQHAAVSHIGVHALHESVFGDQGLDGRQLYRINCRAECLDSGM